MNWPLILLALLPSFAMFIVGVIRCRSVSDSPDQFSDRQRHVAAGRR